MPLTAPKGPTASEQMFSELNQRLRDAGCFQSAKMNYALRCVVIAVTLGAAFIGLLVDPVWLVRIGFILVAAFACVQAAFIAHDIGDGALTTSRRFSEYLQQAMLTFTCGTSSTYFHHVHRLHHLSLERKGRKGVRGGYAKNRYEFLFLKQLLAWHGRVFMFGTIALRGFTFRLESIRFILANPASTRLDQIVLLAHYAVWAALPAALLGIEAALVNLGLITLIAGSYIGTILVLNHEGMGGVEEVSELAPFERVLATTRNLPGNSIADLLLGGVNNHIEHHLFPDMPTTHLPKARRIVKEFCGERGLTYVETSLTKAIHSVDQHFRRTDRQRLIKEALS